ncbi:MAG TPA: M56 family metallopeptidase [Gemmatimonadaceae bacterium]|jgi:beta-lactamase regulating signal transducer with metallopeptidase domain|nr:M56 family metallopeptidase [Gemmatimonadaceae bacterium]
MTIAWILYVLLVGTLLAVGAAAVASAMSLAGRSTRWVWTASLAGIAAFAIVAPKVRPLAVVTTQQKAMSAMPTVAVTPETGIGTLVRAARVVVESSAVRAITFVGARVPSAAAKPVLVGWMLATVLLLAIYLLVNVQLSRARRRWPKEELQGVVVRVAPSAGPAVIGMVRAEIVVPRSLLARSVAEQRLILDHEREHLRAGDHLLLGAACLAVIALPWHPAVWYVLARLRLAIELDCDARVLRRGAAPRSYGALLIDMAAHGAGIRVGTLALADRPSHLERRLIAMRATRSRFTMLRAGALCAGASLLVLAACEAKVPTAADIAQMDVAGAQKSAAEAGLMRTPFSNTTDFFVNGTKVSAELARGMEAKNIGSIEVVKSERADGRDTIFVTTVDRMPTDLQSATTARSAKLRGEKGATFTMRKTLTDSTERTLAHVDSAIARERGRIEGAVPTSEPKTRVALRTPAGTNVEPLFLIDGKKGSSAALAALREEDIAAVAVYKGEQGLRMSSDPAATNGVVVVTTKSAKRSERAPK